MLRVKSSSIYKSGFFHVNIMILSVGVYQMTFIAFKMGLILWFGKD